MNNEEAIKYGIEWLEDEYLDAKDRAFIKIALEALEQEPCGDAVSREMAIGALRNKAPDQEGVDDLIAIIKELPSVTQKSETVTEFADRCRECGARYGKLLGKWIPVSERLPEDSGEYLVTVINEDVETYRYTGIAWYAHPKDYDIEEGDWRELMIDETVIAWMPLPAPYEPQESEVKE